MYQQALKRITLDFVIFGDGGQVHVNATLIFIKSIALSGVIFNAIIWLLYVLRKRY